ncbi:MAG: hypothetical protein GX621_03265 [Pirellulaceae bacterium]|nr:hypothetical protein [Pirellulaceae bacterium]
MRFLITAVVATFMLVVSTARADAREILYPVIDGEWWQVAGNPDLGEYTRAGQEPVDFGVWRAADGTWQLWSCIRRTGCGGKGRLFYRWEGRTLTDKDWKPMGIVMEAKPELGEVPGGLQAPHVVRHDGIYYMAYGSWRHICFATSKDGKHFERVIQPDGKTGLFTEGEGRRANSRDAMLIKIDGLWHCYYTACPREVGYGFCRTSPDLKTWSDSFVVSYGGHVGPGPCQNECPHVVEVEPGLFHYFRNQFYGKNAMNWVYCSDNPRNFGIDEDSKLIRSWRLAAPEVIHHEGQYYIAALMDNLKGIKVAKLKWVRLPELGKPVFDLTSAAERETWKITSGDLASVFTNSKRVDFNAPTEYLVATGELGDREFSDLGTGVIESPAFTLEKKSYVLLVSGGKNRNRVYVALIDADTGEELLRLTGDNGNLLRRHVADCSQWQGRKVLVRVVDRATDSWGHVNFGGIYENPLGDFEN